MNSNLPGWRQQFRRLWPAYLVLVLSLIPALIAYRRVRESVAIREEARFDQAMQATRDLLFQRIESFLSALRGVRGLFDANTALDRVEWQKYARSIDLKGNYPGVLDIGFARRVTRDEKEAHVVAMRAAGFPGYAVQADSDRDEYFPIIFLRSASPTSNWAPGWDVLNEPEKRAAIERARLADRPMATGKVMLRTSDGSAHEPGLVIYLPVYRDGVKPATDQAQKEATIGFVFASILARDLGAAIIRGNASRLLDFEVFAGERPTGENLLFDSDRVLAVDKPTGTRRLSKSLAIEGLGQTWTIHFSTLPAFELDSRTHLPGIVLFVGLSVSVLLFGVAWMQVRARSAAEVLTGQVRQSEELLKKTNEELCARFQERQQAEAALAAEKERLAVTLRSIGDGVITTGIDGRVVLLNKAAESLTGWEADQVSGRPLNEVFHLLDENSRERLDPPVMPILNAGPAISRSSPAVLLSRHGSERIVFITAAPIHDQADHIVGAVLVFRDMTENRKLEAELNKASKLESLGLLAGGIAHDFNNILTGIVGNISLANMLAAPDSPIQQRLDRAEQACLRAKEMTGQLLTFARGGAPIKRVLAVPQLLKESAETALLGSNVRCEVVCEPDLRPVEVDRGQIIQVLNNLLLNAVQAMSEGGTIQVRAENIPAGSRSGLPLPVADYIRISIRDHGRGIAPEHLSRIFDPFFTTKHKGRGLGLATAYSIVRKHDGLIEVESQLDHGATFHICLPASPHAVLAEPEDEHLLLSGQGRVLVMDDEPEILNFCHEALKRLGYDAELARDGAEANRRYREARESGLPFAAVIMDLTIPGGMGGKEAIKHLLDFDPDARAIVSSGYSNDPVMADFAKYGFRGMVAKPYEIRQLARVLREVLAARERRSAEVSA